MTVPGAARVLAAHWLWQRRLVNSAPSAEPDCATIGAPVLLRKLRADPLAQRTHPPPAAGRI